MEEVTAMTRTENSRIVIPPSGIVKAMAIVPLILCVFPFITLSFTGSGFTFPRMMIPLVVVVPVFCFCVWTALGMKIVVERAASSEKIYIRTLFYSAELVASDITDVEVKPDDGMNPGFINWPVVGKTRSRSGIRINMGGSAHVRFTHGQGEQFTIVARDMDQANELAALLTKGA